MALSKKQRERVLEMLDKLDKQSTNKILASFDKFVNWMRNTLYDIYLTIRDGIRSLFNWLQLQFS